MCVCVRARLWLCFMLTSTLLIGLPGPCPPPMPPSVFFTSGSGSGSAAASSTAQASWYLRSICFRIDSFAAGERVQPHSFADVASS